MKSTVNFYSLEKSQDLYLSICTLIRELYKLSGQIIICDYHSNLEKIDKLLWTFEQNSFLPHNLNISRNRVSEENAPVTIINPKHPALNIPNKITLKDFDGWVQERGLYFPNEWSENYETLITSNDKGEEPNDGGILISKIGRGHFIYTSYSWFRQLPAGVPGAYKLFSNLLSLGKK